MTDGNFSGVIDMVKIIKNNEEYEMALAEIDRLLDVDPDPDTEDADRLELLIVLVEKFEAERVSSIPKPDPIEAIRFRMEQQGLTQRDLAPLLGSRSKVSEVLSRKRPLSIRMMRALHSNLGIPASILLQEGDPSILDDQSVDWDRFPVKEMINYGWINASISEIPDKAEELLREFFKKLGSVNDVLVQYRYTNNLRSARKIDKYALAAWTARIAMRALDVPLRQSYKPKSVNLEFMTRLVKVSWSDSGPLLAKEFLANHGITLIVERHLSKTHLDGAVIMLPNNRPIIALTIRYDRIDHFWFTLMHELAHLALHLDSDSTAFFDDLDIGAKDNDLEHQADRLAGEALIPLNVWNSSDASKSPTQQAAEKLVKQLGIHPAIVAGRIRHEFKMYRILNKLVGHHQVRRLFTEVDWSN